VKNKKVKYGLRLIYFRHMTSEELKEEFRRYIKD